ncbi:MAG: FdtA/QdtA family cupin domain-containing protein [Holosporales bacterium]|jgi:hypothetical protein|nr:FdtA/QdtA family cupin domain-containing protein [Holosporales bacterium]
MYNLSDVCIINFPHFKEGAGELYIYEQLKDIPFDIKRAFVVKADSEVYRGGHAHKECSQLLIVLSGTCIVECNDGKCKKNTTLNKGVEGLLIPPTIWAEQHYQPRTILLVLADMFYDAKDYIRDYDEFVKFRLKK